MTFAWLTLTHPDAAVVVVCVGKSRLNRNTPSETDSLSGTDALAAPPTLPLERSMPAACLAVEITQPTVQVSQSSHSFSMTTPREGGRKWSGLSEVLKRSSGEPYRP
jgi:hypothetical protein